MFLAMYRYPKHKSAGRIRKRLNYSNQTVPDVNSDAEYSSLLKPTLVSLRMIGVHVPIAVMGCCRLADVIWSSCVMLYRLLYLGQEFTCVVLGLSPTHMFDQIAVIMATTSSSMASGFLAYDALDMARVLEQLDNILRDLSWNKKRLSSIKRQLLILTSVGWVYIALRWVSMLLILDNVPPDQYFRSIFFGASPGNLSDTVIYTSIAFVWTTEILFIHGAMVFVPILFMSFCILLTKSYQQHNGFIRELKQRSAGNIDFSKIRSFHEKLCSLVSDVDAIFGKIVFFWYLFLLITVCLDITQLFTDEILLNNKAKDDVFYFSLRVLYSMLSFLGTCVTASWVSLEAHAALPAVHSLTLCCPQMDLNNKMEAQLLISRLTAPAVGLSGWNFFTINRSFILQITAALTTYVVIVIQMNPQAMRVIHHLVAQTVNNTNNSTLTE